MTAKRRAKEREAGKMLRIAERQDDPWLDLEPVLDEELNRLPEKYQSAIVLCDLEGKTHKEAARKIGCPEGTLTTRLVRGRQMLAKRLTRRGVSLTTGSLAVLLANQATAAVPTPLVVSTAKAAFAFAAGNTALVISAKVAAVAHGVLKGMLLSKLKVAGMVVLALSIIGTGTGLSLVGPQPSEKPKNRLQAVVKEKEQVKAEEKRPKTDRYGDPLPEGAIARLGTLRFRHAGSVAQLAFSLDGNVLASASWTDNAIRLWEATTGKEIRRFGSGTGAVAFSPRENLLAIGCYGKILLTDPRTGHEVSQLKSATEITRHLFFSPDGNMLASFSDVDQNVLQMWNVVAGRELHRLQGPTMFVRPGFAFSADSKSFVFADGKSKTIGIHDTATGKELSRFSMRVQAQIDVALSPDGKVLASVENDAITLWNAATGKELRRGGRARQSSGWLVAFSQDGKTVMTGGLGIALWDARTLAKRLEFEGARGNIESWTFSPDGKTLAASFSGNNAVYLWDIATGKRTRWFEGHQGEIKSVAFSPDGNAVAIAALERNVHRTNSVEIWQPRTGEHIRSIGEGLGHIEGVAFSPDGKILMAADEDGTIRLWDYTSGKEVRQIRGERGSADSIALSADGKTLASHGRDRLIRLWEVATGNELRQFASGQDEHASIVMSPDGKIVAEAARGFGRSIHLWEAATGKELRRFDVGGPSYAIAFSPDGKLLAAGHGFSGSSVHVWNIAGKELLRLEGHTGPVGFVAFSPDGKTLASGSRGDKKVILWEVATGRERNRFEGHPDPITCGAFSPTGRLLASASENTTALVWDLTGRLRDGQDRPARLSSKALETGWSELASQDAASAYRAIWALAAAGEQIVPFIREQLQPITSGDPKHIAQLIAGLDSDEFAVRDKAANELAKLGDVASLAIRNTLNAKPSPEARRRLAGLLAKLEGPVIGPEAIRAIRAIEIIEQIATPDAQNLLKSLAQGAPEARLTQEAKASLERLARRRVTPP